MTHARDTVIDDIVTAITPVSGATVQKSRVYPTSPDDLPRYNVYFENEEIDWGESVGTADRIMNIKIEVLLEDTTGAVDDALSPHCQFIEDQLNPSGSVANTLWSRVVRTEIDITNGGETSLGIAILTVQVRYRTVTTDASSVI